MMRAVIVFALILGGTPMLWLIWIAIILVTPVLAGIGVWRQTHAQPQKIIIVEGLNDSQISRSP
jgi:hypothetical protein